MKLSTTGLLIFTTSLLLIVISEKVLADTDHGPVPPNEEYKTCGTACENTCAEPTAEEGPCILICKQGYFCKSGYLREVEGGRCILPSDCPAPQQPRSE